MSEKDKTELQRTVEVHEAIRKIIERPSLLARLKSRVTSFWNNLKADIAFCTDAFRAACAEGWWINVFAALRRVHGVINVFLGSGLIAAILALYAYDIYPLVGKRWTAIITLSFLVFGLLMTIRVTRKLYEKTSTSFLETQGQVANLIAANEDFGRKLKAARVALGALRISRGRLEERLKPKVEITGVFWDQYEGIGEGGKPDSFQLLRLEVTSSVATRAQVTVDQVELDGYPFRKLHLHIQHKPWDVNKTELLPGRPDYWDVVQKARRSDDIELMHVEPLVRPRFLSKANKFRLKITVACDKGLGVSETITIERDSDELIFAH